MKKKTNASEVEDIITARYRLNDPDIERIGVERGPDGWRCHQVWLYKDVPRLPKSEIAAILRTANVILAKLLQEFEIEDERRTAG